jgi:hypothetical protein
VSFELLVDQPDHSAFEAARTVAVAVAYEVGHFAGSALNALIKLSKVVAIREPSMGPLPKTPTHQSQQASPDGVSDDLPALTVDAVHHVRTTNFSFGSQMASQSRC